MPDKFTVLTAELHRYSVEQSSFRDDVARELEAQAEEMGDLAPMQIAGDQAALMTILVRALGARRCVEVGTFLGYGAIAIARGLPEDGRLICCEISSEYAERARENLRRAGLDQKVEIRIAPAAETLSALVAAGTGEAAPGTFDFAFIDADKQRTPEYFEQCMELLRPGGLIMLDNVYMGGRILESAKDTEFHPKESFPIIDDFNRRLAADERVEVAMLGIADGVTLALKR